MDASGAVRSIQAANVDMPEDELLALWKPVNLERLARTYWKYLSPRDARDHPRHLHRAGARRRA